MVWCVLLTKVSWQWSSTTRLVKIWIQSRATVEHSLHTTSRSSRVLIHESIIILLRPTTRVEPCKKGSSSAGLHCVRVWNICLQIMCVEHMLADYEIDSKKSIAWQTFSYYLVMTHRIGLLVTQAWRLSCWRRRPCWLACKERTKAGRPCVRPDLQEPIKVKEDMQAIKRQNCKNEDPKRYFWGCGCAGMYAGFCCLNNRTLQKCPFCIRWSQDPCKPQICTDSPPQFIMLSTSDMLVMLVWRMCCIVSNVMAGKSDPRDLKPSSQPGHFLHPFTKFGMI